MDIEELFESNGGAEPPPHTRRHSRNVDHRLFDIAYQETDDARTYPIR